MYTDKAYALVQQHQSIDWQTNKYRIKITNSLYYQPMYVWQECVRIHNIAGCLMLCFYAINLVQIHESAVDNWDSMVVPMYFQYHHSLCIWLNIVANERSEIAKLNELENVFFFRTKLYTRIFTCPARIRLSKMDSTSKISSLSSDVSTGMTFLPNDCFRDIFDCCFCLLCFQLELSNCCDDVLFIGL